MESSIGRIESRVQHIQFDVTDLRQDMKTVLREIRVGRLDARREPRAPSKEPSAMHVTLHSFPDLGLIVKAPTGVIYSNQTGGFANLHPQVEGFFVPLRTYFGMRELRALQGVCPSGLDADDGMDEETAARVDWILDHQGLESIRVDRAKLAESWEAWIHVRLSGDLGDKVPLEGQRADRLEAVLIWPNSD